MDTSYGVHALYIVTCFECTVYAMSGCVYSECLNKCVTSGTGHCEGLHVVTSSTRDTTAGHVCANAITWNVLPSMGYSKW